jgi:hypothetical protein
MSDDRLDLSGDLEKVAGDLLKDVEAATNEVKKRKQTIAAQESREAEAAKSRKTSLILIAVGTVLVLLISYWVVFARGGGQNGTVGNGAQSAQTQTSSKTAITCPNATQSTTQTTRQSGGGAASQGSQVVEHPPDEYERPTDDPGM